MPGCETAPGEDRAPEEPAPEGLEPKNPPLDPEEVPSPNPCAYATCGNKLNNNITRRERKHKAMQNYPEKYEMEELIST